MAELPRLAAGPHVLFLFSKSQAASANREFVFFGQVARQDSSRGPGRVDVGEKDLPEGGRFCAPNWPNEASAPIRR